MSFSYYTVEVYLSEDPYNTVQKGKSFDVVDLSSVVI